MAISTRAVSVSAFSSAGLLLGAALLPAGTAFAAGECATGATLVADGICEVTFTETPNSNWTPPAGITKLQALVVGAGGAAGQADGDAYAGGGGDVQLVELSVTGAVEITVGVGGDTVAGDGGDSEVVQGSIDVVAAGGQVGAPGGVPVGGASGSGYSGDTYNWAGAGAGGDANAETGGAGLVVNEIDPTTFTLFANDDSCLGGGGAATYASESAPNAYAHDFAASCGGGMPLLPADATWNTFQWTWIGAADDMELTAPVANSGGGAGGLGLLEAEGLELLAQRRVVGGQHGHGEQGGIGRPRLADGKGGHRHALGHLHDAVQRVYPRQGLGLHRHAQHRHHGLGRDHARQVGCAACTCCCTPCMALITGLVTATVMPLCLKR